MKYIHLWFIPFAILFVLPIQRKHNLNKEMKLNITANLNFFQDSWELQKDEDGIQIFTRTLPGTKLKQRRGTAIVQTSLSGAVSLIKDTKAGPEWIDRMIVFKNLKVVNDKDWYTYSELEIPWPFDNRDLITRNTISQDPVTKIVTIKLVSEPQFIPHKEGKVRMGASEGSWTFEPLDNGRVRVNYIMWSEPGKIILPQAFVTPIIVRSIYSTMENMKHLVELDKYRMTRLSYIKESMAN